jgi:hypothetical protein
MVLEVFGVIEAEALSRKNFKETRLARLREVREQESLITRERASAYRKIISIRKNAKTNYIKEALLSEKRILHNKLTVKWQCSLVDTGHAHRTAAQVLQSKDIFRSDDDELIQIQQMNAIQRGKEAAFLRKNEIQNQLKLAVERQERSSIRKIIIKSDREDAR